MAQATNINKLPLRPDLLMDTKYPTNIAIQMQDLTNRIDILERFYGVISDHNSLGNLSADGHTEYAFATSSTDRNAVTYLSNKKNRLFIGSGAPFRPESMNPTKGDFFLRTDDPSTANHRVYICTVGGGTPTWLGIL
jgi:hypothetical protein